MSGINPHTDEEIFYPGEKRTKIERVWDGSSMWGGGLSDLVGPVLFVIAALVLAYGFH